MKVLGTGATGFIGFHVAREFAQAGYTVRVTKRAASREDNLTSLRTELGDRIEVRDGDLLNPAFMREVLQGCEGVVHAAGKISLSGRGRDRIFAANFLLPHLLFETCLKDGGGGRRIVFLASHFGLGRGEGRVPADETIPFNLEKFRVTPYFDAKRHSELDARRFVEWGLPIISVYPTFCLGPGDLNRTSSSFILDPSLRNFPFVPRAGFNFVDVRDVALGMRLALEKGRPGERYLMGGSNLPLAQFYREVDKAEGTRRWRFAVPGIQWSWRLRGYPPGTVRFMSRYWFYSDRKARTELGYRARPLEETIRAALAQSL